MKNKTEELYQRINHGPEDIFQRVPPSIEGIVKRVSAKNYSVRETKFHLMELEIDSFDRGNLLIECADYRIDRGERVRLYSKEGFEHPFEGSDSFYVHGIQILKKKGEVKFQATFSPDVEFR